MRITLPTGVVLEGTPEQVAATAKALGHSLGNDGFHYASSTRGLIPIVDMENNHLQNAICKLMREWSASLSSKKGIDLASALRMGNTDRTFVALCNELVKRVNRGKI